MRLIGAGDVRYATSEVVIGVRPARMAGADARASDCDTLQSRLKQRGVATYADGAGFR